MLKTKKIGLALSGGGYRAAAFHLGTLRKLSELGLLDKVDVLSTISGGSITGAAYCLKKADYHTFEQEMITKLSTKNVLSVIFRSWEFMRTVFIILFFLGLSIYMSFTQFSPFAVVPVAILVILLVIYQFRIFPVSRVIARAYDSFFYEGAKLPQLGKHPKIAIGATNIQTCRPFTFSNDRMGDTTYTYGTPPTLFTTEGFPVSLAVMASSCVPFAFSPVSIDQKFYQDASQYGLLNPKLVDGGVFDNQGIHKITESKSEYNCDIVMISDAGNKLPFEESYNNAFTLLLRTVNVFMQRIKNFQTVRNVYQNTGSKEIAYLSLPWTLDKCITGFIGNLKGGTVPAAVIAGLRLNPEWVKQPDVYNAQLTGELSKICNYEAVMERNLDDVRLAAIWDIGTNLTCIKRNLIEDMITHAANLTEIQIHLYCPSLFSDNE